MENNTYVTDADMDAAIAAAAEAQSWAHSAEAALEQRPAVARILTATAAKEALRARARCIRFLQDAQHPVARSATRYWERTKAAETAAA